MARRAGGGGHRSHRAPTRRSPRRPAGAAGGGDPPQAAGWFDYHEKYADDGALELCPPQNVADSQLAALETAARRAWNAAGLSGYARLDFLVPADRPPVLLEANTLPGFTSRSLFPLSASRIGLPYRELCLELAAQAWGRTRG
ncbi:MAG: hypothetical protein R3E96_15595 [Planctomycetota bacterium]